MKNIISALFVVCLFLMMAGCKSQPPRYITVESVKTEWRDRYIRDSIYLKDSVIITKNGDTITIEKYKYIYRDRLKTDSINKYFGIQIPLPYEVKETVYVDRPDSWLDTTQKYICRIGLAIFALYFIIRYRSKIFKFIRKWVFKV